MGTWHRAWLAPGAGVLVGGALLGAAAWFGWVAAVPVAVGWGSITANVARWPRSDGWTAAAALAGTASLVSTVVALLSGYVGTERVGLFGQLEVLALLLLVAMVTRYGRRLVAVGAALLAAVGQALWLLRFVADESAATTALSCAAWSGAALVAAGLGAYPRLAAARARRLIDQSRRQQRRKLERDLHDYVAHDISGILVQAQAARYSGAEDPAALLDALRRIEDAAQQAMRSMDRALELLRDDVDDEPTALTRAVLADGGGVAALLQRFAEGSGVEVDYRVELDGAVVSAEVADVLHRTVAEALTNVRRHAPAARRVSMCVGLDENHLLRLEVSNDGVVTHAGPSSLPAGDARTSGGTGLDGLSQRATALGGELRAGRAGPAEDRWTLHLVVPVGEPS